MKAFLWSCSEVLDADKCAVAWSAVQRPLQLGDLGVLDLQLFGDALRLRWLGTQRTRALNAPPRLLTDGISPAIAEFFHKSVLIEVGNGALILFWTDRWMNNNSITEIAPHLVAEVPPQIRRSRILAEARHNNVWHQDIRGPLTVSVLIDYTTIRMATSGIHLQPLAQDTFRWK